MAEVVAGRAGVAGLASAAVVGPNPGRVVVVGGALMDLKAHSRQPLVPGTSNPAHLVTSPGGVGRNIAENLARLGTRVQLVAVIGPDGFGDQLVEQAQQVGIDTSELVHGPHPTGTYIAVLDVDGELSVALSDLSGTEALTVGRLEPARETIVAAEVLVIDANLPLPVVGWLLDIAAEASVRVVLEPVSVAKSALVAGVLKTGRPVWTLTPNADELAAMTADLGPDVDVATRVADLHARGVEQVWVRRGARGSLLAAAGRPAVDVPGTRATVVDVTGAGDSMTAGFVHAVIGGASVADAVAYGQSVAALTVTSPHTVRPDLTDDLVRTRLGDLP